MADILSGVPALLNGANVLYGKVIQIQSAASFISNAFFLDKKVSWGIYLPPEPPKKTSDPVLEVDGFLDFDLSNASQVANYRIEKGQFASYNKVDSPYTLTITVIKNGDDSQLREFLATLDNISNDLKLYDIVTPQQVYNNANVLQYSYTRTPEFGYNTLYVNITFMQILSTDEAVFNKKTITTSGQKPESLGTTTPKPVDNVAEQQEFSEQELLK